MKRILMLLVLAMAAVCVPARISAAVSEGGEEPKGFDPKETIFEHLGDGYGWEVPFNHHKRIPLPIIVWGKDGLHCFLSSRVEHGKSYTDGNANFRIAGADSKYKGKIVEIVDGEEYRPWDISITKNVCALFITVLLVVSLPFPAP